MKSGKKILLIILIISIILITGVVFYYFLSEKYNTKKIVELNITLKNSNTIEECQKYSIELSNYPDTPPGLLGCVSKADEYFSNMSICIANLAKSKKDQKICEKQELQKLIYDTTVKINKSNTSFECSDFPIVGCKDEECYDKIKNDCLYRFMLNLPAGTPVNIDCEKFERGGINVCHSSYCRDFCYLELSKIKLDYNLLFQVSDKEKWMRDYILEKFAYRNHDESICQYLNNDKMDYKEGCRNNIKLLREKDVSICDDELFFKDYIICSGPFCGDKTFEKDKNFCRTIFAFYNNDKLLCPDNSPNCIW